MYGSISRTRAIAVFTALSLALGLGSASAANTVDGCRATIIKEAQGFAKKKATALRKCEDGVLKGKITGPCPDTANAAKIADAMAKAEAKIAGKCAGLEGIAASGACTADDAPEACCSGAGTGNCFPANIGYGTNCPRVECLASLGDEVDIAACVTCNAMVIVDDLRGAAYDSLTDPSSEKDTLNCQRTVGKEVMGAFAKIGKAKQKCEDALIKGKVPSCPDAKANDTIGKALAKIADKVEKKCGGGVLDGAVKPAAFVGSFGSQAGIGPRVEDVAEAQVQSSLSEDACGDAIIQNGETCDDGNNFEESGAGPADTCPADCSIGPCDPPFGSQTATVSFDQGSAAVGLTGLTVVVRYDDQSVAIPGSGNDASVTGAVAAAGTFSVTPNDTNYALRAVLVDGFFAGVPSGAAFTIDLDTCDGAPAPTAADFSCQVVDAADENLVAVDDATCSVSVP